MLNKFLFLFPLEFGANIVAWGNLVVHLVIAVAAPNILSYSAVNQGNVTFSMAHLLVSLLLLAGVRRVSENILLPCISIWPTFPCAQQENHNMLLPWLFLQTVGSIESIAEVTSDYMAGFESFNSFLVTFPVEVYSCLVVLSLFKKLKQPLYVRRQ